MTVQDIQKQTVALVKVLSIVLITSAIGLELGHIVALLSHHPLPRSLNPIFWLERFAVGIHFIEGIIAAAFAPSRNKGAIGYGVYTFFVGTVGLFELLKQPEV